MVTIIEGITEPNCFMGVNFYQIYSVGEDCSFILFELVFVVGVLIFILDSVLEHHELF